MSEFEIKPASEVPDNFKPPRTIYPFCDMAVGTAFYVPADHPGAQMAGNSQMRRAAHAAHSYGQTHGMKFRTSTQPDGSVRIERVK